MKKNMLSLIMLGLVLTLVGCAEYHKEEIVEATVTEKDYDAAKTTTKLVNGKTKTSRKSAEYDVTLDYNGVTLEVDNEDLYNKVKEGDKVKVTYKVGYDEKDKVVSERIIYKD